LDVTRSDNVRAAAELAIRGLPLADQQRIREIVVRRLEAPAELALEQRGRSITLASSRAPQITFEANGREQIEYTNTGRRVLVRASLSGDQLVVSSTGARGDDYYATFDPIDQGRRLRVARRIDIERLARPVTVNSVYDRISDVAQLNLSSGNPNLAPVSGSYRGDFIVPNGTWLVAILNNHLSTRRAREGDRFTLTVRSPAAYEGALIEGYVSRVDRPGQMTGRAEMSLEFERIRLRGGRSYDFAGFIEGVRTPSGERVGVDVEGGLREGDSQTQ
jgi:hypothetical protein